MGFENGSFLAVIVLYYKGEQFIGPCLDSIASQTRPPDKIIIVDNGSEPPLVDASVGTIVRSPRNLGVAGGFNFGLRQIHAKLVVLVTQDVVLEDDCIAELARALETHPSAAIAGCKLLNEDGTLQHAGATISYPCAVPTQRGKGHIDVGQYDEIESVPYVTGAVLAIRRMARFTPRFRTRYFPAYYEDPDICFQAAAAGYQVLYVPAARATHASNSVIAQGSLAHCLAAHRNRLRFVLTWLDSEAFASDFLTCEAWYAEHVTDPVEREALRLLYRSRSHRRGEQGQVFRKLYSKISSPAIDLGTKRAISAIEAEDWQPADRWFGSRRYR